MLLDPGGAPVVIPPGEGPITAAHDGTLSRDGQPIGAIAIVATASAPSRAPGTRFEAPADTAPLPDGRLQQGMLERSNVDPVGETASMIEASRLYEMIQGLVDEEHTRIRNVIETFSRSS